MKLLGIVCAVCLVAVFGAAGMQTGAPRPGVDSRVPASLAAGSGAAALALPEPGSPLEPLSGPDAARHEPISEPAVSQAVAPGSLASRGEDAAPPRPASEQRRFARRDRYWLDASFSAADWAPPEGPVRIALQAGHWKANEAPAELAGIRDNGARAAGKAEWEVNLAIAREAATMLEEFGYVVDVLPAVVPPGYRAHLFISIHADGSGDPRASGFRAAAPRNDVTGRAARVAEVLEEAYGEATGLKRLPTVTRRMSNYYAFNFRRYQHALHPLTIGVILETGFLTSASDRRVIVDDPALAARGIVAAVTALPETPPPGRLEPLASAAGASD